VVIAGIVAVGLAVMSAYGVCAGIGITFSPLMNVLPFLMLGIGVDDMFVIVNSFDRTPESAPISQRVAVVSPSCVSRLLFLHRAHAPVVLSAGFSRHALT
jgi:Niemann-Pick C1 protein